MLKYAIIGFGGLGQLHFRNYEKIKEKACCEVELVALCDIEGDFDNAVATNIKGTGVSNNVSAYRTYLTVDELLANEELDFVITALPTYVHARVANLVMSHNIHVFSEKPMAISYEEGLGMIEASRKNNTKLMIGQCMRYDAMYKKLKEAFDDVRFGKLQRAHFDRLSVSPVWGWQNWFMDEEKSGGAAIDLHVHDVDFINYLLGKPKSVTSFAINTRSGFDSITTRYEYDGMLITATADWGNAAAFPFCEKYLAQFENATLEITDGKLMCYPAEGEAYEIVCDSTNPYVEEIVDFIDCIANDKTSSVNPAESSLLSLKIALAEKESAKCAKTVTL